MLLLSYYDCECGAIEGCTSDLKQGLVDVRFPVYCSEVGYCFCKFFLVARSDFSRSMQTPRGRRKLVASLWRIVQEAAGIKMNSRSCSLWFREVVKLHHRDSQNPSPTS